MLKIPYEFYNKVENPNYVKNVLYGDSITADTYIIIRRYIPENPDEIKYVVDYVKIEDFYNMMNDCLELCDMYGKYRKDLTNKYDIWVLAFDYKQRKNCFVRPQYIMKHKVNKKIYRIYTSNNKHVDVTEDHSIIVYDVEKGKFINVKPVELDFDKHRLIELDTIYRYNLVEITRVQELLHYNGYVYDIEVKTHHNFYANEILVHNTDSLFIQIFNTDTMNKLNIELKPEKEVIDEIVEKYVAPLSSKINKTLQNYWNENYLNKMNVPEDWNTIDFKTEIIMDKILFTGVKKRYACRIYKEEKTYYIPPKIKITGLEIKRTDSAKLTREAMLKIIDIIFKYSGKQRLEETKKLVREIKQKFEEAKKNYDFELVGIPSSWSLTDYKSVPTYVYAAKIYNLLIQDICRPGTKGLRISCKYNIKKLIDVVSKYNNQNQYQITVKELNEIKDKLNVFFIPPDYDINKIRKLEEEKIIKIDWDDQYDKIIREKLQVFIDIVKSS